MDGVRDIEFQSFYWHLRQKIGCGEQLRCSKVVTEQGNDIEAFDGCGNSIGRISLIVKLRIDFRDVSYEKAHKHTL